MPKYRIAFVFRTAPHGLSIAREGLDALLASTALTEPSEIGVFFMGYGLLNLLPHQNPALIGQKDFISAIKLLEFCEIKNCFFCTDHCLNLPNLMEVSPIAVKPLSLMQSLEHLQNAEKILTF